MAETLQIRPKNYSINQKRINPIDVAFKIWIFECQINIHFTLNCRK